MVLHLEKKVHWFHIKQPNADGIEQWLARIWHVVRHALLKERKNERKKERKKARKKEREMPSPCTQTKPCKVRLLGLDVVLNEIESFSPLFFCGLLSLLASLITLGIS